MLILQISRLPRYLSGQKEYEVELQFSSGLLGYPDRVVNSEQSIDGEKIPDFQDHTVAPTGLYCAAVHAVPLVCSF